MQNKSTVCLCESACVWVCMWSGGWAGAGSSASLYVACWHTEVVMTNGWYQSPYLRLWCVFLLAELLPFVYQVKDFYISLHWISRTLFSYLWWSATLLTLWKRNDKLSQKLIFLILKPQLVWGESTMAPRYLCGIPGLPVTIQMLLFYFPH